MHNRTRMIAAAALSVALAAGSTTAAMASTTGTKPGAHEKPGAYVKTVPVSVRCAPAGDLAAQLGVSQARLDRALREVKTSLSTAGTAPTENQFEAALARALDIRRARVKEAFASQKPCPGKPIGKPGGPKPGGYQSNPQSGSEAIASAVAKELQVSTAQVEQALAPIFAAGSADPSSPAFAAAARALGVSAQQLATALTEAKQSLAGSS